MSVTLNSIVSLWLLLFILTMYSSVTRRFFAWVWSMNVNLTTWLTGSVWKLCSWIIHGWIKFPYIPWLRNVKVFAIELWIDTPLLEISLELSAPLAALLLELGWYRVTGRNNGESSKLAKGMNGRAFLDKDVVTEQRFISMRISAVTAGISEMQGTEAETREAGT